MPALQEIAAVEAALAQRYSMAPSAAVTHRLALIQLLSASDTAAVDRAVTLLREATLAEPARPDYAVDLSAALLLRYAQRRALADLLEATEVSAGFALLKESDSGACWNFVVALSWLAAREQTTRAQAHCQSSCRARDCFFPYVIDDSPAPQTDPRSIALDGRWTDAAWDYATTELIPQWAAGVREGSDDRASLLRADLMLVHKALTARCADSSVGLAIADIERAPPGSARRDGLLRAAELYPHARSSASVSGPRSASALLDSINALTKTSDQLHQWAAMYRANRALTSGRSAEALREYRKLAAGGRSDSTVFGGRLAFNAGLAIMAQGDQIGGLQRLEAQAETCVAIERDECATAAYGMAAAIASVVGDSDRSEQNTQRALERSIGPLRTSRWTLLSTLRQTAELHGLLATADLLHREARFVAHQLTRPDLVAQELVQHAAVRLQVGDTAAIPLIMQELHDMVRDQLADADQQFFRADLDWIEGEYRLLTGRSGARALLDTAIRQMSRDTNSVRQLRPRLSYARAIAQEGDTVLALLTLDSLLRSLSMRSGVGASIFERARLADDAAAAGMTAATLLRNSKHPESLLRALSAQPFLATSLPHFEGELSRIDLAVRRFGDSVLVWSRVGSTWVMREAYLPESTVRAASSSLDSVHLAELFDVLIRPALAGASATVAAIRVDARGDLAAIPWAALYDSREQRYLVERLAVWQTDHILKEPAAYAGVASSRVLVVDAAPRNGPRALPGAEQEVQRVQAIWGARSDRFDASEGAARTLAQLAPYQVVHFAGHAVLDAQRPERSYLELPSETDRRISGLHLVPGSLNRTRLVVLAACDTRGDRSVRVRGNQPVARFSNGLQSLANAFMAAGAHQVIGAAWAIDDAATTAFMEELHSALRHGAAPANALREAQLVAIRTQDPARRTPRVWAAFQLLGS